MRDQDSDRESGTRLEPAREIHSATPAPDPLGPVQRLGESATATAALLALVGSLGLHGFLGAASATSLVPLQQFAENVVRHVDLRLQTTYEVELPAEPEPEPEPEPEAPPEPPVTTNEPPPPTPTPPQEAPPAAAEAGKVLTAPADPDEPLDLTGEGFISGEGTRFAGGTTAAKGTSSSAVRQPGARSEGVPDGKGKPDAAPRAANLSQPARVIGSSMQNCPWPPEADIEQIHYTRVRLRVVVGPDGRAKDVTVLDDPGSGFGAAVKRCALSRGRFEPALDVAGRPTSAPTPPFVITFKR